MIKGVITVINLQYLKEKTGFIYRADGPHLSRGASFYRLCGYQGYAWWFHRRAAHGAGQ